MKYPLIVHTDPGMDGFSAELPDFAGCFTAGATVEELASNAQEAVELWFDGEEDKAVPAPSSLDVVLASEEARGGVVIVVDVDLSFLDKKAVPVNITMPVYVRNTIDRAAKARGLTRSAFIVESALHAAGREARR
ncbi:type II toxin-antitoxin system HicB family antitoxin [Nitratidesulfovibrio vulgaris]|jgi:predicted RNase H-like HicB family nuclease|uniref:HicB-like antitoxin of toxin-antitoxin system domain-containing protein n=1 Tax=Nitratidesulfovibrio vulgaris (strain DP4) TaxID=391774 RepID=A0A0H3AAC2_NITV4|nr:type II toxin-antitoxin system HicB family antitoxin [Nitratidesulfovibrio vulgaris]ABM28500.1 protein of unknown function UPF0150 [Nitratidesulfovibrio vulgaris DP4]